MRTAKMFNPKETFYVLKKFKYSGRDYVRGNECPSRDITHKQLLKLFHNGFVGYESDFRPNNTQLKEAEIQKEEPKKEESVDANTATIVEDSEESFKVEFQGKVREINRNQIREDGTLTAGGLKAFKD